jgi:hypothetical protein
VAIVTRAFEATRRWYFCGFLGHHETRGCKCSRCGVVSHNRDENCKCRRCGEDDHLIVRDRDEVSDFGHPASAGVTVYWVERCLRCRKKFSEEYGYYLPPEPIDTANWYR